MSLYGNVFQYFINIFLINIKYISIIMGFITELFHGLVKFGRITSILFLIIAIFIFILSVGYGTYYRFYEDKDNDEWINTSCSIKSVSRVGDTDTDTYNLEVKYFVDDVEYNSSLYYQTFYDNCDKLVKIKNLDIQYNKKNPSIVRQITLSDKSTSNILYSVGLIFLLIAGLNYALAKYSNIYAGATGIKTLFDIFFI